MLISLNVAQDIKFLLCYNLHIYNLVLATATAYITDEMTYSCKFISKKEKKIKTCPASTVLTEVKEINMSPRGPLWVVFVPVKLLCVAGKWSSCSIRIVLKAPQKRFVLWSPCCFDLRNHLRWAFYTNDASTSIFCWRVWNLFTVLEATFLKLFVVNTDTMMDDILCNKCYYHGSGTLTVWKK